MRRQEKLDNLVSMHYEFERVPDVPPYPTGNKKQRRMFNYSIVNVVACITFRNAVYSQGNV